MRISRTNILFIINLKFIDDVVAFFFQDSFTLQQTNEILEQKVVKLKAYLGGKMYYNFLGLGMVTIL